METTLAKKKSMTLPWILMLLFPVIIPVTRFLVSIIFFAKGVSGAESEQANMIRGFINWGLGILALASIFLFFIGVYLYRKRKSENQVIDNGGAPLRVVPEGITVIPATFRSIANLGRKALWKGAGERISAGEYNIASSRISFGQAIITGILFLITQNTPGEPALFSKLTLIALIITLVFGLFMIIKRQRDLDKPRYHIFLLLIPLYNIYYIIKLAIREGTVGNNTYGDDPLLAQPKGDKQYRIVGATLTLLSIALSIFASPSPFDGLNLDESGGEINLETITNNNGTTTLDTLNE